MENKTHQCIMAESSDYKILNGEIVITRDECLTAMSILEGQLNKDIEKLAKALLYAENILKEEGYKRIPIIQKQIVKYFGKSENYNNKKQLSNGK